MAMDMLVSEPVKMELSIGQLQLDLASKKQGDEERFCKLESMFKTITQQLAEIGNTRDRAYMKYDLMAQMNKKYDYTCNNT